MIAKKPLGCQHLGASCLPLDSYCLTERDIVPSVDESQTRNLTATLDFRVISANCYHRTYGTSFHRSIRQNYLLPWATAPFPIGTRPSAKNQRTTRAPSSASSFRYCLKLIGL